MTKNPLALIIEDDPEQIEIFSQALRLANFEVVTCADGKEALDQLNQTIPFLVVLDLNLPQVTGDKILSQIRSDQRLAKIRVILATANPRQAEELRDQSDLVLIKPISFTQLKLLAERLHPSHSIQS
jgi:chemosensory pili system protein ChpA (sensor histidine kinase/response regulator)